MPTYLILATALTATLLGAVQPAFGLALFVAGIAPTSSLPWHLGAPNVNLPVTFLACFCVGRVLQMLARRMRAGHEPRPSAPIPATWNRLLAAAVVLSGAVALAQAIPARLDAIAVADLFPDLVLFSPTGIAGAAQATAIAALGPLLVVLCLSSPRLEKTLVRGFAMATLVVVATALLQFVAVDSYVRPDLNGATSTGLIAFFQDPHSLAAALVLLLGVSLGHARRQHYRRAWQGMMLLALAAIVLSNSRTGILAALSTVALFASLTGGGSETWRRLLRNRYFLLTASIAVAVSLALVVVPATRTTTYEALDQIGLARLASPLDPMHDEPSPLLQRSIHWRKAAMAVGRYPLWGIGPGGMTATSPPFDNPAPELLAPPIFEQLGRENAHNYILQIAAEFGLFPAILYVFAIIAVLRIEWMAFRAEHEHDRREVLAGLISGQAGFLVMCTLGHPLLLAEFQGLFWISALLGLSIAGTTRDRAVRPASQAPGGPLSSKIVVASLATYLLASGVEIVRSLRVDANPHYETGLYPSESMQSDADVTSESYRWTRGRRAAMRLAVEGAVISLPLRLHRPAALKDPVSVRLRVDGRVLDNLVLRNNETRRELYWMGPSTKVSSGTTEAENPSFLTTNVASLDDRDGLWSRPPDLWRVFFAWQEDSTPSIWLEVHTSSSFVPAQTQLSSDYRRLGVAVGQPVWQADMPPDGTGLYAIERDAEGNAFRWSRGVASQRAVPDGTRLRLQLRADNPDLGRRPLRVEFAWNGHGFAEHEIDTAGWNDLVLDGPWDRSPGVLTVSVSRTWRPSEWPESPSADDRVLGVALRSIEWTR